MLTSGKYFEIEAQISLYASDRGRETHIKSGYRPHIYFGYSDPNNPNFASDCIINLRNRESLNPGEGATVQIFVLKFDHLINLLERGVKLKIKEGHRFIGEGRIERAIGYR